MTESCKNCKFSFPITHWDYTKVGKGEEWKKDLEGLACVLFTVPVLASEKPFVIWKTGSDDGICECWAKQAEPTKVVPPSLADVYKWERDVALSQLEEYGIGFAEKKRDDLLEVVRCKRCDRGFGSPVCPIQSQGWAINTDTFYCAWGERREP